MKRVYWRPQKVSKKGLAAICIGALIGLSLVLRSPIEITDHHRELKWAAARKAATLFTAIKQERLRRGLEVEAGFDPAHSGVVGGAMSLVTSRPADLRSKQTSVNPNFAAAIVDMLTQAGVQPGDTVAVGWSGSFPAFNMSLCAALETLQARPLIIASATASQYGANLPELMWLDMENVLREQGHIQCRSAAVTIGGGADRGLGMPASALAHIDVVARRNQIPMMHSTARSQAVRQRMKLYRELAGGQPIKVYVNVGGGVASTGGEQGKHLFQPGLNQRFNRAATEVECVMGLFAKEGVPVIHLNQAKELAANYGFPVAPTELPTVGVGKPFHRQQPNRWLAALVLVGICVGMQTCVWNGKGYAHIRSFCQQFRPRPAVALHRLEDNANEPQLMI